MDERMNQAAIVFAQHADSFGMLSPPKAEPTEWHYYSRTEQQRALAAVAEIATTLQPAPAPFDMLAHLRRQAEFSERTFGPGMRTEGVIDHIRKELREIEADPADLKEWIDVVILALDGARRAGGSPEQIIETLVSTQTRNEARRWPDWRTAAPDRAIEHDRSEDRQMAGEA